MSVRPGAHVSQSQSLHPEQGSAEGEQNPGPVSLNRLCLVQKDL